MVKVTKPYSKELEAVAGPDYAQQLGPVERSEAGQCTLTPPDPYKPVAERRLVPRWFQTLHLSSETQVSKTLRSHSSCAATPRRR
jgi:hypothetical protein